MKLSHPRLAAGCSFHAFDNGGGSEEFVLATGDGRQLKISALAHRILARLDGATTVAQIAKELNDDSIPITTEQLLALLEQQYKGVVEDESAPVSPVRAATPLRPGFPILLAMPLIPQRLVQILGGWLQYLYWPAIALPMLGLIVWTHVLVYSTPLRVEGLGSESYLWVTLLCLLSIVVHELGHAAAVSRFGGSPGTIGWGLYLLLPTFFADVSQLWRFPRKHRMVVDLGGAYFQLLVFALFAVLAVRTGNQELLATCHLIDVMVLMALNPLFHFDGYWFLADYLALPKLQTIAFRAVGNRFRRLTRRAEMPLELPPMGGLARVVFWSYSALASFFLIAVGWLIYRYLSNVLLTFPQVAPQAFTALVEAVGSGQLSQILVRLMTLFFLVAFPATAVIGLALYILRLVRLCGGRLQMHFRKAPQGG